MEILEKNIIISPQKDMWEKIFARPSIDNDKIEDVVKSILNDIRKNGDKSLFELTQKIDKCEINSDNIKVSQNEIESATQRLSQQFKDAIKIAKANIEKFHKAQLKDDEVVETMNGVVCSRRRVAIEKVGLYIPAGSAPLFSTLLMCAIPAKIAGCKEIVVTTPANSNGKIADEILYCAKVCGIETIYKIGGAMAIGALAYGTESVTKVYKIFGPGNRYVTIAKQLVGLESTSIDIPAGPSEVMVIADESCNPKFVAADLLSQLEHGNDSQAITIVNSKKLGDEIVVELYEQASKLSRLDILSTSLNNCLIIVEDRLETILEMTNYYAPEHLIVSIKDSDKFAYSVSNAGSIFIGNYSPESVGDYASGTNHTLPTSGWAKSCSGVNTDSFSKYITYQKLTLEGLKAISETVEVMARHEGLTAHENAVKIRVSYED